MDSKDYKHYEDPKKVYALRGDNGVAHAGPLEDLSEEFIKSEIAGMEGQFDPAANIGATVVGAEVEYDKPIETQAATDERYRRLGTRGSSGRPEDKPKAKK